LRVNNIVIVKEENMCSKRIVFKLLSVFAILTFAYACRSTPQQTVNTSVQEALFLQNNIHAQKGQRDTKASYANWTDSGSGHIIIPVNTPVKIGTYNRGLTIINLMDKQKVFFEFNTKNMDMGAQEYINLITAPSNVNLQNLSSIDQKGIKDGKAYVGMSKRGVRIALGYPATHMTPSLESNTWVYWRNRFSNFKVEFDASGKVTK